MKNIRYKERSKRFKTPNPYLYTKLPDAHTIMPIFFLPKSDDCNASEIKKLQVKKSESVIRNKFEIKLPILSIEENKIIEKIIGSSPKEFKVEPKDDGLRNLAGKSFDSSSRQIMVEFIPEKNDFGVNISKSVKLQPIIPILPSKKTIKYFNQPVRSISFKRERLSNSNGIFVVL
ncbi:unnamed protein product [Blepharisma stoltei]|uniref:Uncharacterized protein n=1 Tax=Blepharisma stoltei TaxID=1481888 RepID=A0AAU9JUI7_9CILI|nr:unnamed protein product [Blepharisma stoltei]